MTVHVPVLPCFKEAYCKPPMISRWLSSEISGLPIYAGVSFHSLKCIPKNLAGIITPIRAVMRKKKTTHSNPMQLCQQKSTTEKYNSHQ